MGSCALVDSQEIFKPPKDIGVDYDGYVLTDTVTKRTRFHSQYYVRGTPPVAHRECHTGPDELYFFVCGRRDRGIAGGHPPLALSFPSHSFPVGDMCVSPLSK